MKTGRNDPCPCGSGKKFKACCGASGGRKAIDAIDPQALLALFHGRHFAALEEQLEYLLTKQPRHAFCWGLLGATRQMLGKDALPALQKAAALSPGDADAHYNVGVVLLERGQIDAAESSYRRALALDPRLSNAYNNLGNVLLGRGRTGEAADCFRAALRIDPGYGEAHANLGITFVRENQFEEAEACYREAIACSPARADFLGRLAFVLKEQGKREEARDAYREWARRDAHAAEPRLGEVILELPIAPRSFAETGHASENFDLALEELTHWLEADPSHPGALAWAIGSNQPFHLAYRLGNHAALLSRYGDLVARVLPSPELPHGVRARPACIRLVIVANQVRRHSVWDIVLRGLLSHLDRTRFELVLYHTGNAEDAETAAARAMVDTWRETRQFFKFDDLLEKLREDAPDAILYPEIGMDPLSFRLAAHRLAPLQMASWGHPITTGLPSIDLYLSGELLESEQASAHYREKLIRLPGTGCCTTPLDSVAEPIPEIARQLSERNGPRFVIAQRAFKLDPAHDALYAEIAWATGDCTLILLEDPVYPWATAVVCERLEEVFRARALDPARYLIKIPWLSTGGFRSLLKICDVFLDCPAFSGYTTAWQAVHAGLPTVTLEGEFMRQRLAAGLLRKIGMTEMIAADSQAYVAIAVKLAQEALDPERRQIRRAMLSKAAPLADEDQTVVRAFERTVIEELARRKQGTT
ncbi:hypothetical protein AGMMS50256_16980 [Betaproteobacteria bacterium]|nr:hypothetical protein AGMMS50256_16980 [Betaproteobacteria bacterium]